jgi:phosphate transport system substrate-binding protein
MVKFLKWCLTDGQKYAAPLFYAPLPQAMIEKELQQINQINLP